MKTLYRNMTRKPRSRVRIFKIYRTWAITSQVTKHDIIITTDVVVLRWIKNGI